MRRVRAQGSGGARRVSTTRGNPGAEGAEAFQVSSAWPKLGAEAAAALGAGIGDDGLVSPIVAKIINYKLVSPNRVRGNTRGAAISASRRHAQERELGITHTCGKLPLGARAAVSRGQVKLEVTLVNVSPGRGMDDDNLIASLKYIRDGVAKGAGLSDDSDPRIEFWYESRRGQRGQYEVHIEYRVRPLERSRQ